MILSDSYAHGYEEALSFYKVAGGPGSGVAGRNTAPIGMPHSPHVSVGTRKGILDNMHWTKKMVCLKDIKCVGQHKYVPKKLAKMVKEPEIVKELPIDVLQVGEHEYHVIDGHHRYLAAKELGLKEIPARVRKKAAKTMEKSASVKERLHNFFEIGNPDLKREIAKIKREDAEKERTGNHKPWMKKDHAV